MGQRTIKIGLDSNVFKNRRFLEWLRDTGGFDIHISIIVFMETLLWYLRLGLSKEDFIDDLNKIGIKVINFNDEIASRVVDIATRQGKKFPFRYHARDYVIGATSIVEEASLITYNIKHFGWLKEYDILVQTPEEFILEYIYK